MSPTRNKKTTALPLVWDFSPLFASDTDPRIVKNIEDTKFQVMQFSKRWKERADYLTEPSVLATALEEYDLLNRNYGISGDAGYYFGLRFTQDETNPGIKAEVSKIEEFARNLLNEIQFFDLRLGKIPLAKQQEFLNHPDLAIFRHHLQKLFNNSKYLLSEAEERILNLKGAPAHSSWTRMVSSLLAKESRRGKNLSQLLSDLSSTSKSVRDQSAKDAHDILGKHVEVAENELNAILANKKIDDQLRGFARPDQSRHLADDIESEVVDTMTNAVSKQFSISERYYKLKAEILGVTKLKYWERNVPFGKLPQKYTYSQSVDLVTQVLGKLDSEFADIFTRFVKRGQLDVYPRPGKRGGAFCSIDLITHPTYILLNHTDRLNDVLTLAHEMGHGINNELMKTQRALNFGSPLSLAEVASTFMEDFVLQELLIRASPKQRLALYIQKLDSDISSIFRQVAAYNFEKQLHTEFRQAGYLPKEKIGEIFLQHMASYMGKYVEQSKGAENYWVYWSHFRTFFYVYSYASGLLISKSLQAKVKQNPDFILAVKSILSAGSAAAPREIFQKHAQIDIADFEFWTKGLKEVELLLTQAEKLWKEIA
jgi:oligoendopeptidase F